MPELKATIWDVLVKDEQDGYRQLTKVGVVDGGWEEWMQNSEIDRKVSFWFDSVDEVKVGATFGDELVIAEIYGSPQKYSEKVCVWLEKEDVDQKLRDLISSIDKAFESNVLAFGSIRDAINDLNDSESINIKFDFMLDVRTRIHELIRSLEVDKK